MHTLDKQIAEIVKLVRFQAELIRLLIPKTTLFKSYLVLQHDYLLVTLITECSVVLFNLCSDLLLAFTSLDQIDYVFLKHWLLRFEHT